MALYLLSNMVCNLNKSYEDTLISVRYFQVWWWYSGMCVLWDAWDACAVGCVCCGMRGMRVLWDVCAVHLCQIHKKNLSESLATQTI